MARTGRRPGDSGTREAILHAARGRFAAAGYRGATIRAIAGDAGVDPALVHHYFGTKRGLFVAALELPIDPPLLIAELTASDRDDLGERLVRTFLDVWDHPDARARIQALLTTAFTDDHAARMLREFIVDTVLGPVAEAAGGAQPRLRATLVGSQLVGMAVLRFVLHVEPLASAPRERLVAAYAPTLQRYLTDPTVVSDT